MPKVGDKHFSYSESGKRAARKHAQETGQKVDYGSAFKMKGSQAKLGMIQGTSGYRSALKQKKAENVFDYDTTLHEKKAKGTKIFDYDTTIHEQQSSGKDKVQKQKKSTHARLKEWLMTERGFNQADADRMIKEGAYTEKDLPKGDVPAEPKGKSPAKQMRRKEGDATITEADRMEDTVDSPAKQTKSGRGNIFTRKGRNQMRINKLHRLDKKIDEEAKKHNLTSDDEGKTTPKMKKTNKLLKKKGKVYDRLVKYGGEAAEDAYWEGRDDYVKD